MIIRAAVTHSDLKICTNIAKKCLEFLATPTSTTTDAMALKFSRYYATIKKLSVKDL